MEAQSKPHLPKRWGPEKVQTNQSEEPIIMIQQLDLGFLYYKFNRRVLMSKQLFSVFFFSLLLSFCFTQNCVGSLSDDLIQAGTLDIFNPGTNGRQTLAQTQVLYTIPSSGFQSTFSFIDLQYNSSQGIDFTIRGGRIGATNFLGISLLLLQDRRWDKIKISYLVNSRKDIWLGSFTYSPYGLNSGQNNSGSLNTQVQGAVQGWESDSSNLVFLKTVFVSGLQTGLSNFSFNLINVTFDKVRGVVGVTLANSTKSIDMITISYLILISPHSRFIFDSFNYPGTVPVADYGIIGSSGFSTGGVSAARYYGINIESIVLNCQGACPSSCVNKTSCSQANGIQTLNDCLICPANTKYNQTKKACVPLTITCGVNEEVVNSTSCQCVFGFIKLGEICVSRCGVNQEWNGTACACSKGNANITNVCRPCPAGSAPNANRTTCECGLGSIFDDSTLRCVAVYQCQQNSVGFVEGAIYKCRCNANYYASGNTCVYCPASALWNTSSLVCYCPNVLENWNGKTCITCGSGQYFNSSSKQCECFSPRIIVSGECKCPNSLIWNNQTSKCECPNKLQTLNSTSNTCICASPYIRLDNGECGLVCPENEWWSAGECKCKAPFVRINGKCTMNCTANERWNGIECSCNEGFFRVNGVCATCAVGMFYNTTAKACQNICGLNEFVNGTQCVCKQNYFRINGICSQCPLGTGYKASSGICVSCDQNEIQLNSICICKLNFYRINGTCGQCPQGTLYNQQNQVCDAICTKVNEVYDGKNCVCAANFYKINGICIQCVAGTAYNTSSQLCDSICKANQIFTNGVCTCVANFVRINGTCGQCPAGTVYNSIAQTCSSICKVNEVFDGTTCVCTNNFVRISGVCGQCPENSTYNKVTQVCDLICQINEVLTNGVCVCAPNFYRVSGVCKQCSAGTVYNTATFVCDTICKANQTFDGTACVCVSNLYRIGGICGQCPSGTTYNKITQVCDNICKINEVFDGTKCVCASGFIVINGACGKCPTGSYYDETLKKCVIQPTCPSGAEWNQAKLQCQCSIANQYIINGACQACGTNSGWNGTKCVCRTGFFLIGGECLTCDINSSYNSTLQSCICNRGFYGDRTLCQKCHATCGKCSGPNSTQCLDCVDVSYTLTNGTCTKPASCIAGMYLSGSVCKPCSAYCSSCSDQNTCTQCTSGFSLSSVVLTPTLTYTMCEQICGDGKRYEYSCDDANTNNGDGCSDQCEIESGWSCSGGTTTSKSVCMKLIPSRSIITPKGAVQLSGKVMQGITLSFLPDALTSGGCPKCSEVLLVQIIQAQVIPSFRVNFLPTTQYKFLIEFDFQGIFGIPPFTFTLRINPDYAKYFSNEDMAQQLTITVDPAVLALGEEIEDLTIEEILGEKISIADGDLKKVFN